MKVLIVKLSAFGDIIHALPALDDLLSRPEVDEVHWLVDQRYGFVTEAFPEQVHVHSVALKGPNPLRAAWNTVRALRRQQFDAVIDLQGLIKSTFLARLIATPVFGFDPQYAREKPSTCFTRHVCFHPQERHIVQQCRRVAAALFAGNPAQQPAEPVPYAPPHVALTETMREAGARIQQQLSLSAGAYVILHIGGGWQTKQLPASTWRDVARGIALRSWTPVYTWGNGAEQEMAKRLARNSKAMLLPERLNMSALCGLLAAARATVGADTGVLHLAAALNTPTVTFWGPSASWRSGPIGEKHWHIESNPSCGPCFKRSCDHFICMEQIQAPAILEALHETGG
ncbi:MAG: lipopolysaccharide heptosyltransferase I [Mariprofundaceae bacterium]|nr:lipopolysaccharide heptosyltransferase I [Mariprofundaceae bacterium]